MQLDQGQLRPASTHLKVNEIGLDILGSMDHGVCMHQSAHVAATGQLLGSLLSASDGGRIR